MSSTRGGKGPVARGPVPSEQHRGQRCLPARGWQGPGETRHTGLPTATWLVTSAPLSLPSSDLCPDPGEELLQGGTRHLHTHPLCVHVCAYVCACMCTVYACVCISVCACVCLRGWVGGKAGQIKPVSMCRNTPLPPITPAGHRRGAGCPHSALRSRRGSQRGRIS